MNNIIFDKIRLIRLYKRWIEGDLSVKDEALELRARLKNIKEPSKEEPVKVEIDESQAKPISVRGEIKDGKVIEHIGIVKTDEGNELIDLKEGKKVSFASLLGEEVEVKSSKKEEEKEVLELPPNVQRVESIEEIIEEEEKTIDLEEKVTEPIEEIIEDKEKERLIMKILNSKPKKVPEAPERAPEKREMPEEEKKKIPEKHRSKFATIINMISQIFKVLKR